MTPPPPPGVTSEYGASLIFAMLLSSEYRISNIEYHANFTLPFLGDVHLYQVELCNIT